MLVTRNICFYQVTLAMVRQPNFSGGMPLGGQWTYSLLFSNKHHNNYRRFFKKCLISLWLHKWHNEFWEQGNFCSKFETSSGGHYMIHSVLSLSEKKSSQWTQLFHKYYITNVMETFLQSEWILIIPSQLHSFWSWKTWGKKCQN